MQEILSTLRIVGEIQKIFNYTNQRALVLRGNDSDIARAEWLIQDLDQQPGQQAAGTHVFNTPTGDDVTRIFYVANATPQGLQTAVTAIRTEANVRRVFSTTAPSAVVVRGTSDQVRPATGWPCCDERRCDERCPTDHRFSLRRGGGARSSESAPSHES
jgi:hypothetical protein